MGGAASLNPFNVTFSPFFPIIVTVTTLILIASAEDHDSKENGGIPGLEDDNGATTSSSPPPTASTGSSGHQVRKSVAFKPSTAVIVGVLTTTFSLTFLLLLYIKHCNSGNTFVANNNANLNGEARLQERKNSGIEREVVESLPVFRFGSLRGQKHGLECAVCLNGFEDPEVLRLLPKCKHAFHVECVDTWLDEHSTCPLCRDKVNTDTDDVVQVERQNAEEEASSSDIERGRVNNNNNISNDNALQPGNVGSSRRVSSVGERESGLLEIVLQAQGEDSSTSSFRRSLDSANRKSGAEHRLEHRIIVSPSRGVHQRWSDLETSDLLYLTSDMIISDASSSQRNNNNVGHGGIRRIVVERNRNIVVDDEMENGFGGGGGRRVGNMRSVSAMTGMRRILSRGIGREREHGDGGREEQERRREGVVSRWLAWTPRSQSQSQSQGGDVR